jgi:acetyl-CoA carboxylase biotin carboxyl carrier protein
MVGASMAITVEAHITGTVFTIETQVGSQVQEGDPLLILESMKMEMPVEAPVSGRVTRILVEEGQGVEEGAPLVVLD